MQARWTAFEDAVLRRESDNQKAVELLPHRTVGAIRYRRTLLRLISGRRKKWKSCDDQTIMRLYPDYEAMRRELPDRTLLALRGRASQLGITLPRNDWLASDIKLIRDDGGRSTTRQIHGKLKGSHSLAAIDQRRHALGVQVKPRPPVHRGLRGDITTRAAAVGLTINELGRRISGNKLFFGETRSFRKLTTAVSLLGGELYAEWED